MSSNYFQPNAAGHGHPQHHPPLPNHQYAPRQNMTPYASVGGAETTAGSHHGNVNSYGTAAGNNASQYSNNNNMGSNNNNQTTSSYSSLGTAYGSMVGDHGQLIYQRNDYAPMGGGGNDEGFKYTSLAPAPFGSMAHSAGVNRQQPMGGWNAPQQHQEQQQLRQQQKYHQREYLGHSYNPNSAASGASYSNISYNNNNMHANSETASARQRSLPAAVPPPPPPLPEATTYPDSSQNKKSRWKDISRKEIEASRGGEDPPPRKKPLPRKSEKVEPPPKKNSAAPPSTTAPNKSKAASSKGKATDKAVDAFNALTSLQNRWSATSGAGKSKETKNQAKKTRKGQKKRARKKKNANGRPTNQAVVVIRDPGEKSDAWIDVEDATPSTKKRKSDAQIDAKAEQPSKSQKSDGRKKEFDNIVSNPNNFPPLASKSQGGDDSAGTETLEELSTPQLISYSAAIGGALDQVGEGNESQSPKSRDCVQDDDHEEMDISDEEEEAVDNSKRNEGEEQNTEKSVEASQESVDLTVEPVTHAAAVASEPEAPIKAAPDTAPQPPKQGLERIEKEKRALKLAELRAKAKLARVKLRIAERKKARGNALAKASAASPARNRRVEPSPAPVSTSPSPAKVRAITVGSLVIEDVALTGPPDEVRLRESVYISSSLGESKAIPGEDQSLDTNGSSLTRGPSARPAGLLPKEETRKKSELLKQKLQLARLQLEMKKKILEKRKALSSATKDYPDSQPYSPSILCDENEQNEEGREKDAEEHRSHQTTTLSETTVAYVQDQQPGAEISNGQTLVDELPSQDQAYSKLQQLRRRQKELKQKNDIANLRNLIHRQRDLLRAQGRELSESSTQLQSCVDDIGAKQSLLDESERRLEELNHRKQIVEGMVLRATEQLIAARKAFSERR